MPTLQNKDGRKFTHIRLSEETRERIIEWMAPRESMDTALTRALDAAELLVLRELDNGEPDPRPYSKERR